MAENLHGEAHRYSKLIGRKKTPPTGDGFSTMKSIRNIRAMDNISPPVDGCNIIYMSFLLGGIGFLMPYNSFVMAMDYFKVRYPDTPVVFEMSLVYIVVAFLTVLANNLLVETFSLNSRINFGYAMSFVTLIFVVLCEVWWEAFGTATSYTVNLAAVAIVSVGCTIQQSSFYGYTSMLPPTYTQAVMVGESVSGVFTSLVRVMSKIVIDELRGSTVYFFTVSASTVLTCFAIYHIIRRSDFIQFYMALFERAKTRIILEPTEDAGLIETNEYSPHTMITIQSGPPLTIATTVVTTGSNGPQPATTNTQLSFANPAYEPTASAPTYKVEDIVIRGRHNTSSGGRVGISGIKRWIEIRCEIMSYIHYYMIAIFLTYLSTLVIYPGVASEIISCTLGSWMPILIMLTFNFSDFSGKMLTCRMKHWPDKTILRWAFVRLIFTPVVLFCIVPRNPQFTADFTAFLFTVVLGVSNGLLGSLPMIQAPLHVDDRYREITGNLMTLMYMLGLTTGSLLAYSIGGAVTARDHLCNPSKWMVQENSVSNMNNETTLDIIHTNFSYSTIAMASTMASSTLSIAPTIINSDNLTGSSFT